MRRWLVLLPLFAVVGCGTSEPEPSPVPVESLVTVSPSVSASMSQEELDAEAERVFRRSVEITSRYELYGDFSGFPAEMNEVAMGEYLETSRALYDFMAEKNWAVRPGTAPIITSEPLRGLQLEGSVTAVHVCTDSRNSPLFDSQGLQAAEGKLLESRFFFKNDEDGRLKIFVEEYREVESCVVG